MSIERYFILKLLSASTCHFRQNPIICVLCTRFMVLPGRDTAYFEVIRGLIQSLRA